jgi:hypothetical protein
VDARFGQLQPGVVDITKSVTILALPGVAGSIVANGADAIHGERGCRGDAAQSQDL